MGEIKPAAAALGFAPSFTGAMHISQLLCWRDIYAAMRPALLPELSIQRMVDFGAAQTHC
jgi:hypothetical protein